jgi:hypothetical protein
MEQKYTINFLKLFELHDKLDPIDIAVLIVIAKFGRPVSEEETMKEVSRLGLDKMNDDELIEWIEDWKRKKIQVLMN